MKRISYLILSLFLITSCQEMKQEAEVIDDKEREVEQEYSDSFLTTLDKAHLKDEFLAQETVIFDMHLFFRGNERLKARFTLATNSTAGRIDYSNGESIITKGNRVFYTDTTKSPESIRFTAFTWSYFFLLPYKVGDNGTNLAEYPNSTLNDTIYNTRKLTFGENIGDAPDDWYILYSDTTNHLLEIAAYIVTAKTDVQKAEEDPHAIRYHNYEKFNGIPISTYYTFWGWQPDEGLTEQLGYADISNVKFSDTLVDLFSPDSSFVEAK